jgi:hypothetical protein
MAGMWPFTFRRILGNRWWAVAFVVFVCWQAVDMVGAMPVPANAADNARDNAGAPIEDETMRQMTDTLNSLENAN